MSLAVIDVQDLESMLRGIVRDELDSRERLGEIMTKKQLAEEYGWSSSTITRRMKDGLPYFGGGHPRFRRSDVDRWLTERESYL